MSTDERAVVTTWEETVAPFQEKMGGVKKQVPLIMDRPLKKMRIEGQKNAEENAP